MVDCVAPRPVLHCNSTIADNAGDGLLAKWGWLANLDYPFFGYEEMPFRDDLFLSNGNITTYIDNHTSSAMR